MLLKSFKDSILMKKMGFEVANFTVRDLALEPLCTELTLRASRPQELQVEPDVVRLLAGLNKLRHKEPKLILALAPRVLEAQNQLQVRSLCNLIKAFANTDTFPSPHFFVELLSTAVRRGAGKWLSLSWFLDGFLAWT